MQPRMRPALMALLAAVLLGGQQRTAAQPKDPHAEARDRMVDQDIVAAGVKNPRVIESARATPRHEFVPAGQREMAYFDMALPIGESQTISPPFVVSYMTEQLDPQPTDTVLEIGTGSGYQAAILSPLVQDVYTIEIKRPLGETAARTLKRLGKYKNVHTKIGDGFLGWPEAAPFDKIVVTCSPEDVPKPLVEQLREGGRMIIPLGERYKQTLYLFRKEHGKLVREALLPTLFVPMTGAAEERRQVKPDPANPKIFNGGFEEVAGKPPAPTGWHYQRLCKLVANGDAPEGKHYLLFSNIEPGRGSAALQGLAIDGRQVREIELSAWVRADAVRAGQSFDQFGNVAITFYDEKRNTVADETLGPFFGDFPWEHRAKQIAVPSAAREAIVRIGLLGAVGKLGIDDVQITVTKGPK